MAETHDGISGMTTIPDDPANHPSPLEQEAQAWVTKFALGQATEKDLQALKMWHARSPAHAAAFSKANRVWEALGPAGRRYLAEAGVRFRPMAAQIPARQSMGRRAFMGGAFAASAAAAGYLMIKPPLGLWPSLSQFAADYQTATGERKAVILADGMSVDMNAQTSIAVYSAENEPERVELISGGAIITAGPQEPRAFTVIAGPGRTVARQASFDVRYIGGKVCVTCLAGDIRVEQGIAAQSLQSGQQVLYTASGISSIRVVDAGGVAAWREGVLVFQGTPLAEAVEEINRYRHGRIILTNAALGRQLFNARFRVENIGDVVGQIKQVFGAKAMVLPGGITLLS